MYIVMYDLNIPPGDVSPRCPGSVDNILFDRCFSARSFPLYKYIYYQSAYFD